MVVVKSVNQKLTSSAKVTAEIILVGLRAAQMRKGGTNIPAVMDQG